MQTKINKKHPNSLGIAACFCFLFTKYANQMIGQLMF